MGVLVRPRVHLSTRSRRQVTCDVLDATPMFRPTMEKDVLKGLLDNIFKASAGDIVIKGRTPQELLGKMMMAFRRLIKRRLFAAAQVQLLHAVCDLVCEAVLERRHGPLT